MVEIKADVVLALFFLVPTYWQQQSQGRWDKLEDVPDDSVGRRM